MESNWEKKTDSKAENNEEESYASKERKSSQEKKMGRRRRKRSVPLFGQNGQRTVWRSRSPISLTVWQSGRPQRQEPA